MYSLISIVVNLVCGLLIFFLFGLIYRRQVRADKKVCFGSEIRTHPPLSWKVACIGSGVVLIATGLAVSIKMYIKEDAEIAPLYFLIPILAVATLIYFFIYAYICFTYAVSTDEGIIVHRLFRKTRVYRYDEIFAFKDTINLRIMGGLVGYGVNRKKIFAIEAEYIGAKAFADRLREKGVQQVSAQPNKNK